MAHLANQSISDDQKKMLEERSLKTGNSIASIVRNILEQACLSYEQSKVSKA